MIEAHQRAVKEKEESQARKRNLSELASTRSKFNYLSKVNNQMQAIKDCHDRIYQISRE